MKIVLDGDQVRAALRDYLNDYITSYTCDVTGPFDEITVEVVEVKDVQ